MQPSSLTSPPRRPADPLADEIARAIAAAGGWLPFDRFMALALHAPGLGYYASGRPLFGALPDGGSDFVTAPELSAQFGRCVGRQLAQALRATGTSAVWEFGAGSGALMRQIIETLDTDAALGGTRFHIVELSAALRARQQAALAPWAGRVTWLDALPDAIDGVLVGNELLDALPVQLLWRSAGVWHERGVVWRDGRAHWSDRPTPLRPPLEVPGTHDYLCEIHPQAEALVRTLAQRLRRGALLFIDYGFPESEYYHPARTQGTLMCHRAHRADADPLTDVGAKDITAHVNFSGIALAAQDAGLAVLGYTSQARFLMNCGLLDGLHDASLPERALAQKLLTEHEMGELFKVLLLVPQAGPAWSALGFAQGDRTHRL